MIFLKITCNDEEQEAVFYDEEVITIGRSPKNTLQIPDKKSSRKHCLIEKGNNAYRIVDLGSRNGTRVNGKKVETKDLEKGDSIVTGFATITVKEIAFADANGKMRASAPTKAAHRPGSQRLGAVPPKGGLKAGAKMVEGSGRIKIHRGPKEMPLGLLDYLLILVILGLILYILGVLFFALKEKGLPTGTTKAYGHFLRR